MNNPNDRGMIKWAPFSAVVNGNELLSEIKEEKSRISKPILSEEQINELESIILEAFASHSTIEIIYYKDNHAYKITGIITKIEPITKKITLNNQKNIFFNNIIRITKKILDF